MSKELRANPKIRILSVSTALKNLEEKVREIFRSDGTFPVVDSRSSDSWQITVTFFKGIDKNEKAEDKEESFFRVKYPEYDICADNIRIKNFQPEALAVQIYGIIIRGMVDYYARKNKTQKQIAG